ncbi:MAG: diguanylate cyclase [Acidobacteriota bacterium]
MATILLVDDEEVNLYALKIILESRGYTCVTASNGPDGLRLASERQPHAILLDIQMPVMDGFEVCRRLKQNEQTRRIPILLLTARYRDHDEVVRGLDLGANDYVTKPFNSDELLARVAVMVRVRNAEEAVRHASLTDELTGLYNRRTLQQRLEEELHRAIRYSCNLSCIMLDIDHFKKINDTHGHPAGDSVLVQIAEILRRHVRKSDLAVRYGGEEFLLVLFGNDKSGCMRVAERVRADVESHGFEFDGTSIRVTISSGVATFPDDGVKTAEDLVACADSALYEAKTSGRNVVRAG